MKDESKVIRDITQLGLSPQAEEVAKQLLKKTDMRVVFLIDSSADKNYAGRHPKQRNEYWATIKPQRESSEYERIILAHIFRAVLLKKRQKQVFINFEYMRSINGNNEHLSVYGEFLGRINAYITTLAAEMFLAPKGYVTSKSVRKAMFQDRMIKLQEYINIRKKQPFLNGIARLK